VAFTTTVNLRNFNLAHVFACFRNIGANALEMKTVATLSGNIRGMGRCLIIPASEPLLHPLRFYVDHCAVCGVSEIVQMSVKPVLVDTVDSLEFPPFIRYSNPVLGQEPDFDDFLWLPRSIPYNLHLQRHCRIRRGCFRSDALSNSVPTLYDGEFECRTGQLDGEKYRKIPFPHIAGSSRRAQTST